MLSHRPALLFALLLPACAAHEGPTDPPSPVAVVEVKVASVQLVQDCSDPPTDAAAEAAAAPAQPVQAERAAQTKPTLGDVSPGGRLIAPGASIDGSGPGSWSPPCTQSTMQLSIANTGDREGRIRIAAVRLLDAPSKRELGKITARKPSQWNPGGTYQPWSELLPAGATVKVGYRLGEPDWPAVDQAFGTDLNPYARPYVLEVDVAVDGVTQTVRSPEFVREPVHMIVT